MNTQTGYGRFTAHCAREYRGVLSTSSICDRCEELWTIARRLHTLAEAACNGELTPRQETRDAKLQARAGELCGELGFTCRYNGDPRGFALYVNLPSGASNSWSGEGWGIG